MDPYLLRDLLASFYIPYLAVAGFKETLLDLRLTAGVEQEDATPGLALSALMGWWENQK